MYDKILIIDFGSQYTQLIARRIRELHVYCEIVDCNSCVLDEYVKGVILSGSPCSIHNKHFPDIDLSVLKNVPVMGICYGAQLLIHKQGGEVQKSNHREYGRASLDILVQNQLLKGLSNDSQIWMSHADTITKLPNDFECIAKTESIPVAGFKQINRHIYGLQFHPEVTHTTEGKKILRNFVVDICKIKRRWTVDTFVEESILALKKTLEDGQVVLGLSGGVDSSVTALLLHKAIGEKLHCIFVDNGLLRKNEFENVLKSYQKLGLNVKGVDAKQRFYKALKGVSDPEKKRKIIGNVFIEIFEEEARAIKNVHWLAQGTIYPDVIESASVHKGAAKIKSHHNVGGLPEKMNLKIVEPLNNLFKDEVRNVGKVLKVPNNILQRHPFPGPGLGVRILGTVDEEKVKILQESDYLFMQALKKENLYQDIWQAGAILLPVQSVGVMGDDRTYESVIVLRAVNSVDGMTADWVDLPNAFLRKISNEIINKVKGINRVVYDISSKPPATIEWE